MQSVIKAGKASAKLLREITEWEKNTRYFPKPNLVENKVYAVRDSDGNRFYARFCFGCEEFWWTAIENNSEVSVAEFSRETL